MVTNGVMPICLFVSLCVRLCLCVGVVVSHDSCMGMDLNMFKKKKRPFPEFRVENIGSREGKEQYRQDRFSHSILPFSLCNQQPGYELNKKHTTNDSPTSE